MSLPKIGAFLTLFFSCQFALGATVSQEREELTSLQRNLSQHEQRFATVQAKIESLPAAIAEAQKAFSKVDVEYQAEKDAFNKIKIQHTTSPSADTERQLKLAEIKFGLAERRYEKAKGDLEELQEQKQDLRQQLASAEAAIADSRSRISRQQQRLADAIETAERQEREAAERERQAQLTASKPVVTPPKAEIAVPPPAPEPEPEAVAEQPVQTTTVELTEDELSELEFAKEKMAHTEQLVAQATDNDRPSYSNLELTGSNFDSIPFQYLGNDQYRTDVTLHKGRHSFRIEDLSFRVDVPEHFDSAQDYVFLVDASDRNRLKASYFRKELLGYFDKEVVLVEPEPTLADQVARAGVIETADGIFMSEEEYEEFQFAKEKMAETEELIAAASASETPNFEPLELRNSNLGDTTFQYLGNQQYRLEAALPTGRHVFRIERLRFDVNVPESKDAQDYVFLVDARDRNNLRASYFRKFLLDYADKEVAVAQ